MTGNPVFVGVRSVFRLACIALMPCCLTVTLRAGSQVSAQVTQVSFQREGNSVVVFYDLVGRPDQEYLVQVVLREESDPSFVYRPRRLTGDVGQGRFAGARRRITWNIEEELPGSAGGKDYYFVVTATPVGGGIPALVWLGAGVVVVGGAATYLLLSHGHGGEAITAAGGFPVPPGRP